MAEGFGTQPQFDTADFNSSENACTFCKTAISAGYYRVNGKISCANCTQRIKDSAPKDTHAAFVRAVIFGAVASVIGMALYATIEIVTKFTIGYLALGVGYIVAKAMMMGSRNIGGRRYQIVAVLLTYFAISTAIVPVALSQLYRAKLAQKTLSSNPSPAPATSATQTPSASTAAPGSPQTQEPTKETSAPARITEPSQTPEKPQRLSPKLTVAAIVRSVVGLTVLGLASPLLELRDPAHGIIGLIILFVGLNIAWRMTAGIRKVSIEGPY